MLRGIWRSILLEEERKIVQFRNKVKLLIDLGERGLVSKTLWRTSGVLQTCGFSHWWEKSVWTINLQLHIWAWICFLPIGVLPSRSLGQKFLSTLSLGLGWEQLYWLLLFLLRKFGPIWNRMTKVKQGAKRFIRGSYSFQEVLLVPSLKQANRAQEGMLTLLNDTHL